MIAFDGQESLQLIAHEDGAEKSQRSHAGWAVTRKGSRLELFVSLADCFAVFFARPAVTVFTEEANQLAVEHPERSSCAAGAQTGRGARSFADSFP